MMPDYDEQALQALRFACAGMDPEETEKVVAAWKARSLAERAAQPTVIRCQIDRYNYPDRPLITIRVNPDYMEDFYSWPEVTPGPERVGGPRDGGHTTLLDGGKVNIQVIFDPAISPNG